MKLSTLKFTIDCLIKKHGDLRVSAFASDHFNGIQERAGIGWNESIEVFENPNGSITFIFMPRKSTLGSMRRVLRVREDIAQKVLNRRTK